MQPIYLYRTVGMNTYRTVGMNTYRTIHKNQFQLNSESGW